MTLFPNVALVGARFRGPDAVAICNDLEGKELTLLREPDNAYDPNAIQVFFHDMHIAYVERGQAAWIAPLMDEGASASIAHTGYVGEGKKRVPLATITVE